MFPIPRPVSTPPPPVIPEDTDLWVFQGFNSHSLLNNEYEDVIKKSFTVPKYPEQNLTLCPNKKKWILFLTYCISYITVNDKTCTQNFTHPVLDHHHICCIFALMTISRLSCLTFFCLGAWEKDEWNDDMSLLHFCNAFKACADKNGSWIWPSGSLKAFLGWGRAMLHQLWCIWSCSCPVQSVPLSCILFLYLVIHQDFEQHKGLMYSLNGWKGSHTVFSLNMQMLL